MKEIDRKLQEIFRDTFSDPDIALTNETNADDIANWDSATHITLIFTIEDRFGITFSSKDLENLSNVGELKLAIAKRT